MKSILLKLGQSLGVSAFIILSIALVAWLFHVLAGFTRNETNEPHNDLNNPNSTALNSYLDHFPDIDEIEFTFPLSILKAAANSPFEENKVYPICKVRLPNSGTFALCSKKPLWGGKEGRIYRQLTGEIIYPNQRIKKLVFVYSSGEIWAIENLLK